MAATNPSSKTNEIIFKCDPSALISGKLQDFYTNNEFFDTVLIAGSDRCEIHAHKVVLCALSEYFLEMVREEVFDESEVDIKEIQASILKTIIDFMYSGFIKLSLEKIEGFLRAACFLKIKTLIDGCCELIEANINSKNSLNWFRLACELNLPGLKNKSLECTYTHFEQISKEKEILMLSENELKDLLFNSNPYKDFEEYVFLSMVEWVNHDKLNRSHLALQLLSMVRFQALTPKFIIENRNSVSNTQVSSELIFSWLQWHISPETLSNDKQNEAIKQRKKPSVLAIVNIIGLSKINIETFNPKSNSWLLEFESSLPSIKKDSYSTILVDEKLILCGTHKNYGDREISLEYLDLYTMKWITLPPMKARGECSQMVTIKDSLIVLVKDYTNKKYIQIYNFSTFEWYDIKPEYTISAVGTIAAHQSMLYIIDFENGKLQSYDDSSKKWTSKSVHKDSLRDFGFVAGEGFLYVIGGQTSYNEDDEKDEIVKRYNLCNGTWCEMASLPSNLKDDDFKSILFQNKIIIGKSDIYEYNIDTDTWNTLSPSMFNNDMSNICNLSINIH